MSFNGTLITKRRICGTPKTVTRRQRSFIGRSNRLFSILFRMLSTMKVVSLTIQTRYFTVNRTIFNSSRKRAMTVVSLTRPGVRTRQISTLIRPLNFTRIKVVASIRNIQRPRKQLIMISKALLNFNTGTRVVISTSRIKNQNFRRNCVFKRHLKMGSVALWMTNRVKQVFTPSARIRRMRLRRFFNILNDRGVLATAKLKVSRLSDARQTSLNFQISLPRRQGDPILNRQSVVTRLMSILRILLLILLGITIRSTNNNNSRLFIRYSPPLSTTLRINGTSLNVFRVNISRLTIRPTTRNIRRHLQALRIVRDGRQFGPFFRRVISRPIMGNRPLKIKNTNNVQRSTTPNGSRPMSLRTRLNRRVRILFPIIMVIYNRFIINSTKTTNPRVNNNGTFTTFIMATLCLGNTNEHTPRRVNKRGRLFHRISGADLFSFVMSHDRALSGSF